MCVKGQRVLWSCVLVVVLVLCGCVISLVALCYREEWCYADVC